MTVESIQAVGVLLSWDIDHSRLQEAINKLSCFLRRRNADHGHVTVYKYGNTMTAANRTT
jgi:hypothetical protein